MSLYVDGIMLHNWLRFRGQHYKHLEQRAYGVTASWEGNPRRSNYGGKSAFLEAIRFAIDGWHRWDTEDEWITRGEKKGGVYLELADDRGPRCRIERTRAKGSSTKLVVYDFEDVGAIQEDGNDHPPKILKGDEAQAFIQRLVGYTPKDFEAGPYFGQKSMDRFVTQRAGVTMAIVAGWLNLAPLDEAADSVGEQLSKVLDEVAVLEGGKSSARDLLNQVIVSAGLDPVTATPETIEKAVASAEGEVAKLRGDVALCEQQRDNYQKDRQDFADARQYNRIVAEGLALREKVEGYFDDLPTAEQLEGARISREDDLKEMARCSNDVDAKSAAWAGKFDGKCPINGCACPIRAEINDDVERNEKELAKAEDAFEQASACAANSRTRHEALLKLSRQYDDDVKERGRLLKEAERYKAAAMRTEGTMEPELDTTDKLSQVRAALAAAERVLYAINNIAAFTERNTQATIKADISIERLMSRAKLLVEAKHILGKQGAQRVLSKDALDDVEQGANIALDQCGIDDLSVAVQWEHEGKDLARNCDACGSAFPSSARVKSCARCGVERGKQVVNDFKIVPSDRSGAADDLAGITFQLASADWLKRDRDAGWSVAILDEPTGSLDAEHRQAVAGKLPQLLAHFGYVQSFIVSHDPAVVHACPAVIEIEAGPDGSRLKNPDVCKFA